MWMILRVRLACVSRIDELVSQNAEKFFVLLGRREIHVEYYHWTVDSRIAIVSSKNSRGISSVTLVNRLFFASCFGCG